MNSGLLGHSLALSPPTVHPDVLPATRPPWLQRTINRLRRGQWRHGDIDVVVESRGLKQDLDIEGRDALPDSRGANWIFVFLCINLKKLTTLTSYLNPWRDATTGYDEINESYICLINLV